MLLPFPTWLQPSQPPTEFMGNLRLTLENLRASAAIRAARHWVMAPLAVLLSAYISSVLRRFGSLTARYRAGRLIARAARRRAQPEPRPAEAPLPRDGFRKGRMPGWFGWLIDFLPYHAAGYASQLRHMLAHDAEIRALIATSPQAGRILRPLCRMLGIEPGPDLPPSLFPPRVADAATCEPQLKPRTRRRTTSFSRSSRPRLLPGRSGHDAAERETRDEPRRDVPGLADQTGMGPDHRERAAAPPLNSPKRA